MKFQNTKISGVVRVALEPRVDARGTFSRVFDLKLVREHYAPIQIVQVNRSLTRKRGTIRGLHHQRAPSSEEKIVQCLRGSILDVAVDIDSGSPTYRQWVAVELSAENMEMLIVPRHCAHGFQALSDDCVVEYFVSEYYAPDAEEGFRWDDPAFGIEWPIAEPELSPKDRGWPFLEP
jgi:dTDP-4-dehydrorhamnose 3,5-epimerase